jgi:hypothetical protein
LAGGEARAKKLQAKKRALIAKQAARAMNSPSVGIWENSAKDD